MGLAASQARLLTITSRKSRAQFESMKFSHEKLTLSRNLTEISNEYQNSLDKTKLYYDFYGVNSTDVPLTYNMLMSPSSINDYTPTLISNNQGQIVLSSPYAAAARAAGIPMEGLGCTPSNIMRNAFMLSLADQNVITQATANAIVGIDYNQSAGLGGDKLINTITETGYYEKLLNYLDGNGNITGVDLTYCGIPQNVAIMVQNGQNSFTSLKEKGNQQLDSTGADVNTALASISFSDLLSGDKHIYLGQESDVASLYQATNNVITQLGNALSGLLEGCDDAIAYANDQMNQFCWGGDGKFDETTGMWTAGDGDLLAYQRHKEGSGWAGWEIGLTVAFPLYGLGKLMFGSVSDKDVAKDSLIISQDFLAVADSYGKSGWFLKDPHDQATLDLSAFTQAWFTYFMQYMYGLGTPQANGLNVEWNAPKNHSNFADKDSIGDYEFTFTSTFVSDNEALISNFYDTLFNQICINGWTENNQAATDSNYLKEMLQGGKMYLTSLSDDHYYYQNNYSTNNFIKEVSDDAAIAQAESKYTTEKARINAKEQEIDLKMKNLDTEISSLETEYEAVKKVIEGNVSKSFTRYDG